MGYQLVVWEGEKPETDDAAYEMCRDLMQRYFVGEGFEPTPAIREFVTALTDLWPDDPDNPAWEQGPWKFASLIDEASGPVLFLNMRFGRGERAAFRIAEMAAERGLVTFDTYVRVMRPCPKQVIDDWNREGWAQVSTMLEQWPARRRRDGYRLVVWEGTRPEDEKAARRACDEIEQQYRESDRVEPTPAIRAFVEELTAVWPDDPNDPDWERSIWDLPGIIDDASGPALFLVLPQDQAAGVLASTLIAAMAEERGLVAFDRRLNALRPVSQEFIDTYRRERSKAPR